MSKLALFFLLIFDCGYLSGEDVRGGQDGLGGGVGLGGGGGRAVTIKDLSKLTLFFFLILDGGGYLYGGGG